jgi:hypothetical protein
MTAQVVARRRGEHEGKGTNFFPNPTLPGTMLPKETAMIELMEQQKQAIGSGEPVRLRENGQEYVLVRADVFDRLVEGEYDDSPWTSEERYGLAWEAGKHAGWEDMDEYDDPAEQS